MANNCYDYCPSHEMEPLDVYCISCQQLTCALCQSVDHGHHVTRDVIDVADERRCCLDNAATVIRNKIKEFQDADDTLANFEATDTSEHDRLSEEISAAAEKLKSSVDEKTNRLAQDAEMLFSKRQEDIRDLRVSLASQRPELEELLNKYEWCKNRRSHVGVIRDTTDMDVVLHQLSLLPIDCDRFVLRRPLPHYGDFLKWDVTQFFDMNGQCSWMDGFVEQEDVPRRSWRDVQTDLEKTLAAIYTELESECRMTVNERLGQLREHLDAMYETVGSMGRQLDDARRRNVELTETLRDNERQRHNQGVDEQLQHVQHSLSDLDLLLNRQESEVSERRRTVRKIADIPVNVAFIGVTGVGKSSLINAIRGLTADDLGAAAVGVNECTVEVTAYTHPDYPSVKFWDLPGVGTDRFPRSDYLRQVKVERYHFFVVVSATRFTENDTWLVKELSKHGKKFVFVRTKVRLDVRNDRKAHPRTHSEQAVIDTIQTSTLEHLINDGGQQNAELYLVDSYEKEKYDFGRLAEKLLDELPRAKDEAVKSRCLIS